MTYPRADDEDVFLWAIISDKVHSVHVRFSKEAVKTIKQYVYVLAPFLCDPLQTSPSPPYDASFDVVASLRSLEFMLLGLFSFATSSFFICPIPRLFLSYELTG